MTAKYHCCDDARRALVRLHGVVNGVQVDGVSLNGIDFLEVIDGGAPSDAERQRKLVVHFVKEPSPALAAELDALTRRGVTVTGGVRVRDIRVDTVKRVGDVLEVHVTPRGDFSPYTLTLADDNGAPLQFLDEQLSAVEFSFKVECEKDFDCAPQAGCEHPAPDEPDIDYLAKDYASFRQLMLDRMSVVLPRWGDRNAADLGVALVELLAYVGDHLSYQQDAVATEAYLGTARRRASVRRHARFVDYAVDDGCNARAWVHFRVRPGTADLLVKQGTRLPTQAIGFVPPHITDADLDKAVAAGAEVFETMHDAVLFAAHNVFEFYTWGRAECCLPRGATSATLKDWWPKLKAGDVLVFEEILGPITGKAADADPAHRHAVRLTADPVKKADRVAVPTETNPVPQPVEVTEIRWGADDALPFDLCISGATDALHGNLPLSKVSVARGNVALADHGRTVSEPLPPVPPTVLSSGRPEGDRCDGRATIVRVPRFAPELKFAPLTHAATVSRTEVVGGRRARMRFDPDAPAAAAFEWAAEEVFPVVTLTDPAGREWLPQRDLLGSAAGATDFVAEVDDGGDASVRFGDDRNGAHPAPGTVFQAEYRVGNGTAGNVGAGAIKFVVGTYPDIDEVRNPLPARGGTDPERLEDVRQKAPAAFRVPMRAVTADDYAEVAQRRRGVQRAAATIRWTGSWRTAFVAVDRLGGLPVDPPFRAAMGEHLERFRMAGQDAEVVAPRFVFLEVEVEVCVDPDFYRDHVVGAVLAVLGSGTRPDGTRGLFHPDNLTFGQPVFVSQVTAAAQRVAGVRSVEVRTFRRLGTTDDAPLTTGELAVGRLEVARLDNDPNFPDRGAVRVIAKGGR